MIFEVTPAHIQALNDVDLRTLIGHLAEREVVAAGHSAAAVTYGGHQLAKDGGIDVRVALASGRIKGFVPRLSTGYQAKAEDFSAAAIKSEMRPKGELRESIRDLGRSGGAYIIVSSKGSVSDSSLENRRKAMAEAIANEPDAKPIFLDFYDKRRLATWTNQHPGIIPWVRERVGQPLSGWRPFQDWSSSPENEDGQYLLDEGVRLVDPHQTGDGLTAEEGINRLRSILSEPKGVVRLVGLSGVGKTRLVQALFDDRVGAAPLDRHLAVYTDMGDNPDPVPGELLSRLQSNGQRCIFIVDNCGIELHRNLATRLSASNLISLITVEYDISDDDVENTDVFMLEPASKDVIERILNLRHPTLTNPEIRTIADFSEGNFRIALALANTSRSGQSLANLRDSELFNRLFRQKNEDDPALLRGAKICSLVYSFDVETSEGDKTELPLLAALAGQSVSEFHGHVAELKRRQLVQVRARWRALLPHALAHRLANLALEDLPPGDIQTFVEAAPERLLKSFSRRLGCLHDSAHAQKIVGEWLASGGMIAEVESLNPLGMVILDNVAPVHPEAALNAIQRATASSTGVVENNPNASALVRLLRSLAYEPALFDEATRLIAEFARSKTQSNNMSDAVNVFKSLFHIHLSGTHAAPKQRADLLRKLASSGADSDQALVLAGLDAMLECSHFSSSYGFEFGTRKRDYGFHPRTYGEQWDWYAETFLLAGDLAALPAMRTPVRSMVAAQFSYLAPRVRLDDLIALAERFVSDGGWPEGWAGVCRALRQAKKAEISESVRKLSALESKVAPGSLAHRIATYVLPARWSAFDVADIDIEDEKRYGRAQRKIEEVCEGIGAELARDLGALRLHIPDLLASNSDRVFTLAKAVGKQTSDAGTAWKIIEDAVLSAERNTTIYNVPSGFLLGLSERDRDHASKLLDAALAKPEWHPFLPQMQLSVGLDKAGTERLIAVVQSPALPAGNLGVLIGGRATDDLEGEDFKKLMASIAAKEDGFGVAIQILYMRLFSLGSDKKPVSEVERDVARLLLPEAMFDDKKNREPHMLAEVVRLCLRNPEDTELARGICQRLLAAIGEWKVAPWDFSEVVTELAASFPRVVLEAAFEPDEAEAGSRRGLFGHFRESRPCPLRKIADDELLGWALERPETRFPALAASVLGWTGTKSDLIRDIAPEDEDETRGLKWTPTALRLIHEAPNPVVVLKEFEENFRPSSWSGSLAEILSRREALILALADDPDQRIRDWVQAAIPKLRDEVEATRKWEADNDRERHERFDW
ncbi:hypothetical protein [Brevundimonas sp. A19_0]|uniref:hypothetical protein n=1 Tax=Brevundimonas sp. A19_0 TaxID=2821087 RepID=UPI001ADB9AF5|nr:hypothetical protein [Brevundimonas sp. A19_0]MBO9501881.1 hypothetical protein [Brevundimonas sp. A19_0]